MTLVVFAALVFAPMLLEAVVSRKHEARLRARGAVEPADDVYRVMQVAYPLAFVLMLAEGFWRGFERDAWTIAGTAVFIAAKLLKAAAVTALGERWTFRVLVVRGEPLVATGPYRIMRHPNYVAVVGELAGVALFSHAVITGWLAILGFGALMLMRIRAEETALGLRPRS